MNLQKTLLIQTLVAGLGLGTALAASADPVALPGAASNPFGLADSWIMTTQTGNGNDISVEQSLTNINGAEVVQDGDNNDANISQTDTGNTLHPNWVSLVQDGDDNVADITQVSDHSEVNVVVMGNRSDVDIDQAGLHNYVLGNGPTGALTMDGDDLVLDVTQTGINNVVVHHGPATALTDTDVFADQIGNGNHLHITQL